MALTISQFATGSTTTGVTSITISSLTAAVGDMLIVGIASDNSAGSGAGAGTTPIGNTTDSASNTYARRINTTNDPGAANEGVSVAVYTSVLTSALNNGSITVSFTTTTANASILIWKAVGTQGETLIYSTGSSNTGNGTTGSFNGLLDQGSAVIMFAATELGGDFTADTDTTGGAWSSNYVSSVSETPLASQYKLGTTTTSSTTQTYNPSWANVADYVIAYIKIQVSHSARIYLPSSSSTPNISPSPASEWEKSSDMDRVIASKTKASTAFTSVTSTKAVNNTTYDIVRRQYIYGPIAAQTIKGSVVGLILVQESINSADVRSQMVIRVISSDGTTVRGTLIDFDTSALTNEWGSSTPTLRYFPTTGLTDLNQVTALSGDYIVIEIGGRGHEASATSRTLTWRFGDASGTDLTITNYNAGVDYNTNILFYGTTLPLVTQIVPTTASLTITTYAPTVNIISTGTTLTQSEIFTNTNTFYNSNITYTFVQSSIFTNTNIFYEIQLSNLNYITQDSLFSNTNTFYEIQLTIYYDLTQTTTLNNTNTFYDSSLLNSNTITQDEIFTNDNTFYESSISLTYDLSQSSTYTNTNNFYDITLSIYYDLTQTNTYGNTNTFYEQAIQSNYYVSQDSSYTNENEFYQIELDNSYPLSQSDVYLNTNVIHEPSLSSSYLLSQDDTVTNTNVIYEPDFYYVIYLTQLNTFTNDNELYPPSITQEGGLAQSETLTNTSYFYDHSVSLLNTLLQSSIFNNVNEFNQHEVTSFNQVTQTATFTNDNSFYEISTSTYYNLIENEEIPKTNEFYSHTLTANYSLTQDQEYSNTNTFYEVFTEFQYSLTQTQKYSNTSYIYESSLSSSYSLEEDIHYINDNQFYENYLLNNNFIFVEEKFTNTNIFNENFVNSNYYLTQELSVTNTNLFYNLFSLSTYDLLQNKKYTNENNIYEFTATEINPLEETASLVNINVFYSAVASSSFTASQSQIFINNSYIYEHLIQSNYPLTQNQISINTNQFYTPLVRRYDEGVLIDSANSSVSFLGNVRYSGEFEVVVTSTSSLRLNSIKTIKPQGGVILRGSGTINVVRSFTGDGGLVVNPTILISNQEIVFELSKVLIPNEGLTVRLYLVKGGIKLRLDGGSTSGLNKI